MIHSTDQNIAHSLRDLVSALNRNLRKQLGNPEQLSVAEENVVRILLSQEETLPSELCGQLNMSSQFMSQVLNRLQALEYISRKASKTDKRKSLVSLSRKGIQKIQKRRKEKEDLLAQLIAERYSTQQKKQIAQSLDLLAQLYEDR
ncbi:MAG TPA: MarR family transcriptional regulator [Puia sp.]|nr:MarR family transcriptional regulator [Puia sp.]